VRLELPADLGRLPQDLETTIFRLIQESLTNIHRHSGSKTGLIRVVRGETEVWVEIADEGQGSRPQRAVVKPGLAWGFWV
jgi:two-component system NarL family sensor kinase